MRVFVRAVENGSFSAAARETGATQSTISKQVAALEDHLGCLLLQRTTRSLTLTEDGRSFYDLSLRVLDAVAEAESAVGRQRGRASGRLRLACAGVFGRLHIIPRLEAFMARHPDIEIDLTMHDSFSDLIENGIDLALRVGRVDDSNLIGRQIGLSRRVVVATPAYLARHGTPVHPNDLSRHRCLLYGGMIGGPVRTFARPVTGTIRLDNTEAVRAAVLHGLGVANVPIWHFVEGEIETGQLQVLLRPFEPAPHPITAVYSSRRHLAPKVRAAIDFFAAEFLIDPKLSAATI